MDIGEMGGDHPLYQANYYVDLVWIDETLR